MPKAIIADAELIELPIVRACIEKWNKGRANYGAKFEGNPLDELFAELIDAINYCEQCELHGIDLDDTKDCLMSLANDVRDKRLGRVPLRKESRHVEV